MLGNNSFVTLILLFFLQNGLQNMKNSKKCLPNCTRDVLATSNSCTIENTLLRAIHTYQFNLPGKSIAKMRRVQIGCRSNKHFH